MCRVLQHFAVREIPPEVRDKPHFSWEYYPGSPPKLGEMDRGFHVPRALGDWTVRATLRLLTPYEQREVRDVPVARRKALYPTTPVWWEHVDVPRGMAARVPQKVALQRSQLMGEPLGGPYHLVAVGGPTAGRGAAPQLWTSHPRGGPKISRSGPARE